MFSTCLFKLLTKWILFGSVLAKEHNSFLLETLIQNKFVIWRCFYKIFIQIVVCCIYIYIYLNLCICSIYVHLQKYNTIHPSPITKCSCFCYTILFFCFFCWIFNLPTHLQLIPTRVNKKKKISNLFSL